MCKETKKNRIQRQDREYNEKMGEVVYKDIGEPFRNNELWHKEVLKGKGIVVEEAVLAH